MIGTMLKRGAVPVLLLACAVGWSAAPAKADFVRYYAAVVCEGDQALVRFTMAYNDDRPDFTPNMTPLTLPIWRLEPQDPSRCRLRDGRDVVLRQASEDDQKGYGECGGDSTEVFSLWVGGTKIYSRETWHDKCGYPVDIQAIHLDGASLTECRVVRQGRHDLDGQAQCEDRSERLTRGASPPPSDPPGTLVVLAAAPGMDGFCRKLPSRHAPPFQDGVSWPTYPPPPERVLSFEEEAMARAEEDGLKPSADVRGDGRKWRMVQIEGHTGGFDASFWALAPASTSEAEVEALQSELAWGQNIPEVRARGVQVIAGDLTSYGETNGVHITPFRREGRVWFYASRTYFSESAPQHPSDLVLRATPTGGVEEVCAFRRTPRI